MSSLISIAYSKNTHLVNTVPSQSPSDLIFQRSLSQVKASIALASFSSKATQNLQAPLTNKSILYISKTLNMYAAAAKQTLPFLTLRKIHFKSLYLSQASWGVSPDFPTGPLLPSLPGPPFSGLAAPEAGSPSASGLGPKAGPGAGPRVCRTPAWGPFPSGFCAAEGRASGLGAALSPPVKLAVLTHHLRSTRGLSAGLA